MTGVRERSYRLWSCCLLRWERLLERSGFEPGEDMELSLGYAEFKMPVVPKWRYEEGS